MKILITTRDIRGTDKFLRGFMKDGRTYCLEIKETQGSKNKRKVKLNENTNKKEGNTQTTTKD